MKVLICGSREIDSFSIVEQAVEESGFIISEVVSGGARGVDKLAEQYAETYNLPVQVFPADWQKYGKRAGYLRNAEMVEVSDAVIAVWDGESKGTKHSIDLAKKANKPVYVHLVK